VKYLLQYLLANPEMLVDLIIGLAILLLASGWIKDARIRRIIEDAVAFAEQWRKNREREGVKPSHSVIKGVAVQYAERRLPGVDAATIGNDIESMVYQKTTPRPKAPAGPIRGPNGQFVKHGSQ
jgi:hypothetical protein